VADRRSVNRSMFWRVIRRSVFANRGRLLVILLALGAGAAVTAALLNLQIDAKRRITTEFRSFGANVIVSPRGSADGARVLSESLYDRVPDHNEAGEIGKAAFLYGVVDVADSSRRGTSIKAVLAGYTHWHTRPESVLSSALLKYEKASEFLSSDAHCAVGQNIASKLGLKGGEMVRISAEASADSESVLVLAGTGGSEDDQIFLELSNAQRLLGQPKLVSLVQINAPGSPQQVQQFIERLQSEFPDATGHPVRQFAEGGAQLYSKISGILTATVAVVLILTALCVMAAMTNVAMERKNDVGLMKAIGGSVRRVLRLFLAEAALLGLAGGLIGAAVGLVISIGLGKAVFGVAAQPRLIVYPVSVVLTVIVAILAAYPLRRLVNIRPASVFRGEE
jgi:putative ABC transport system permease protein